MGCGGHLTIECSKCGFKNQSDANFCGGCGSKIINHYAVAEKEPEAERRQLTVMFCDLVGSSELAEQFDPEEYRELLRLYQSCVSEVTMRYGGHIAKYIGDGLLVYFGHPHAHEDDAKRSIMSGLGIIDEIKKLNQTLIKNQQVELKVRIGIHTGLVVIGQMGSGATREENAIVGETPNIAARIESLAKPNTLIISEDTNELVKGAFINENLGKQSLKGVSQRINVYMVIAESNFLSEFNVRRKNGSIPIIGRTRELDFLTDCWEQAKSGLGQIVLLSGEAGVGKSRVVTEFMNRVAEQPQHLRLYHCSSVHANTAFYPIASLLKFMLNLSRDETDEVKYKRLEVFFNELPQPLGKYVSVFAPLLGINVSEKKSEDHSPEKIKNMIFQAWLGLMEKMADEQPLLLIFEDVHWIDPSTQELLNMISLMITSKRILLFITARPGYKFSAAEGVVLQSLTLNRLSLEHSYSMVSQLAGDRTLPDELIKELVAKTDGIPLFIEELTRTMIGSGILKRNNRRYELTKPLSSIDIPRTLKDSLMARLDQLSGVKKIAQLAATIGRSFSIDILKSLPLDWVKNIDADLTRLLDSQLVEQTEANNKTDYQFRHALLQETAYESLLKSTRRYYHGLIADTLVNHFPDQVKSDPGVLARHYTEAEENELAIKYWIKAGKQANLTSSHNEAISHYSKAIELLENLPKSKAVHEQEFQVQVRLIGPLIAAKSYVSPLVEKAFNRALELSKQIDSSPEIFPVLHGRYAFYQVCGLINKAESLVDEFFELAKHHKENYSTLLMIGSRMRGSSAIMNGNAKLAEQYLNDAINIYQYDKHFSLNSLYGQDIKVIALTYLGLTYWHQGRISEIENCAIQASELAKNIPSANTVGISHIVSRVIPFVLLDEPESALKASDKAIEVAVKLETPLWKVAGIIFKGWSLVRMGSDFGKEKEGMALLEQGIAAYNNMNLGLFRPLIMNIYAQACMEMGFIVKGLEALEKSLSIAAVGGELWLDAESHRILAELLLSGSNPDRERAIEEFAKALEVSRQQVSITQELRVAISLYNFAKTEKEINAAITILKNVYDKFDDKKCTKDLLKAEGMLRAL